MSKQDSSTGLNRIWDFFASVKLTFVLLLLLAFASVFGTLLPQKEAPQVYLQQFGEGAGNLILALGLHDTYHAPWFLLMLCLVAVNLTVCSLNRLPQAIKLMRSDPKKDMKRSRKPSHSFTVPGKPADLSAQAKELLGAKLGKVHESSGEKTTLYAQKGAWSRMGVYVVHSSVIIIFLGAVVGNIWGFSGMMTINEGQSVDHVTLERGKTQHLGFAVRLNKFSISFYDSGMPSEYRSDVTFMQGDKDVKDASLIVNDPAMFEGIDFYQSSYGTSIKAAVVEMTRGGKTQKVELEHRVWRELPDGGFAGIIDYHDNVNMQGMYKGPIVRVAFRPDQKTEPSSHTAFKKGSKMNKGGDPGFALLEVISVPYTGLQVKYDPGVWFIWVGCTLMVVGFCIAFYMSHRKVWIWLSSADGNRTRVEIAGGANKNRVGLERLMLRLAGALKHEE